MLGDQTELINYEAVRIKNCVCVCVFVSLYSGMRIDYTFSTPYYISTRGLVWLYSTFPHYLIYSTFFGKTLLSINRMFSLPLQV